jgi:hypothetical protein
MRPIALLLVFVATVALARLIPRRVCRPECARAMAALTLPAPFAPVFPACDAKHPPGSRRCLRVLVRHCRHGGADCVFPVPSPAGAFP